MPGVPLNIFAHLNSVRIVTLKIDTLIKTSCDSLMQASYCTLCEYLPDQWQNCEKGLLQPIRGPH